MALRLIKAALSSNACGTLIRSRIVAAIHSMKTMISASRKQFRQSAFAVTRHLWPPTYRGAMEHLETEDDMAAYLEASLEENDPSYKALSPESES